MKLLRATLGNRRLALLEGSWAAASLGTWAFTIVIALYAYDKGGAAGVGLAVLARMAPSAILAPYVALAADRRSRREVLVVTMLARGALVAAMGLAVYAGAAFGVILALSALFTIAGTAHKPAQAALLPQYARTPAELGAANVAWSTIDYLGFLFGGLTAGLLVASAGVDLSFGLCALPFLAGVTALVRLPADAAPERLPSEVAGASGLFDGFRTVARDGRLRVLVGIYGAVQVFQAMVDVLLVVAALELLDIGQAGLGWLNSAWGLGGLVGGAAAVSLLGRGRLAAGVAIGCVVSGLPLVLVAGIPEPATALIMLVVLGVGSSILEIALLTLTQRLASGDVLGRVFGVQEVLYVVGTGAGAIAVAPLIELVGTETALLAVGLILPIVAVVLRAPLRRFEAGVPVPERAYTLLRTLPIFAPLPVATIENLALEAETVRFETGVTIMAQGDAADAFFVIDEGEVDVLVDGAFRRVQGPGDFFGEIALLHDCARTATVRARTPVSLLSMTRDDFLAGIGAHARSSHEATTVADARLAATPA